MEQGYFSMGQMKTQVEDIVRLEDERFPWLERRRKVVTLAQIYNKAGFIPYAERAGSCATWLQFNVAFSGQKSLRAANFCDLRLCPMCTARRARRNALKLTKVMDAVEAERGCRFLFLTLTVRNCKGDNLGDTISVLLRGWHRLERKVEVARAVGGWFRALEITRNAKTGEYHPHIHAILAVPCAYFGNDSGLYISQKDWRKYWMQAAGISYDPSVRISVTKTRGGGTDSASRSATLEAAKYTTKDCEYIDPRLSLDKAARIVTDYTNALHRRRLTAFGGWLKEMASRFDADDLDGGDLIHADNDRIRDDLADMIETYHWSFGAGDYVLADRQLNPLHVVRDDGTVEDGR